MSIKEKIIQIWLTVVLILLGYSKILIIAPFALQIEIRNRFLSDLIELIFKPASLISAMFGFIGVFSGSFILLALCGFLVVVTYLVLVIIESYFLARLIIFLIKKALPENLFSNLTFNIKNKINIGGGVGNYEKLESVKNYLPVLIFIILLAILYPILTNFIKEKNNEDNGKNETALMEQANEVSGDIDSDNDGLGDRTEFILGTDRYFADTDNDGFTDYNELKNGYNPLIISPSDQLDEDTHNFAEEILFNNGNTEFSDLESLRLKLENQISNELCKNGSYNDLDNLSDWEKVRKAVGAKDPCICSKVSDRQSKNNCYSKLGGLINNETLCAYILEGAPNAEKDKANCFHALMLINLDEKYCYRIREGKNQTGCVLMLSLKTKKYNLCNSIKNLDERDDCYYGVATFSKKIELCDKIRPNEESNNSEREACKMMVRKAPFPKF